MRVADRACTITGAMASTPKGFYAKLERFGGDLRAMDVDRVFRLAGSINSKNEEEVSVLYRHKYRYVLRDLQ